MDADDIRLPFSLGEKRKLRARAARGSGITATMCSKFLHLHSSFAASRSKLFNIQSTIYFKLANNCQSNEVKNSKYGQKTSKKLAR